MLNVLLFNNKQHEINMFMFTLAITKVTIMISILLGKIPKKGLKTTSPVGLLRKPSKPADAFFLSSQGFTQVEVLIVLTIIVLIYTTNICLCCTWIPGHSNIIIFCLTNSP